MHGKADPETYLHRIGRTGRFGRVGVALSFVHDKKSWHMLMEIAEYFGVKSQIQRLDTKNWDEVEETVKKVIKSSRAGKGMSAKPMEPEPIDPNAMMDGAQT